VFRIADGNCGERVVLGSGQRCRVQVDYRPVTEGAASAAELRVAPAAGGPSQSVALQGIALTRGNLVVEALGAGYIGDLTNNWFGSNYQDVFAFIVLILVLLLRPSGLLGERVGDRA